MFGLNKFLDFNPLPLLHHANVISVARELSQKSNKETENT